MKVSDLILELQKLPQDCEVLINKEIPYSHNFSESGWTEYEISPEIEINLSRIKGSVLLT